MPSQSLAYLATQDTCLLLRDARDQIETTFVLSRPGKVAENVHGLTFQNANERAAAEAPNRSELPCSCLSRTLMADLRSRV